MVEKLIYNWVSIQTLSKQTLNSTFINFSYLLFFFWGGGGGGGRVEEFAVSFFFETLFQFVFKLM